VNTSRAAGSAPGPRWGNRQGGPTDLQLCVLEHKKYVVEIDKCVLRFNEIELRIFEPDDVGYFHSFEMLPHFIFS